MGKIRCLFIVIYFYVISIDCEEKLCKVPNFEPCDRCECRTVNDETICDLCDDVCEKDIFKKCVNGDCTLAGCKCWPCWSGPKCDVYSNRPPHFSREVYSAEIDSHSSGVLRGINAFDPDSSQCQPKRKLGCPCNVLLYNLVEGKYIHLFHINPHTGDLAFDVSEFAHLKIELNISVHNINSEGEYDMFEDYTSYTKVMLYVSPERQNKYKDLNILHEKHAIQFWKDYNSRGNIEKPKRRKKRACLKVVIPSTVDARLTKVDDWETKSTMRVTDSITFQFTIDLPVGSTDLDMELSSTLGPYGFGVYHFCDVTVHHIGSNMAGLNVSSVQITKASSTANIYEYDKATVAFGTVVNDGTDTSSLPSSQIIVNITAVVVNHNVILGTNYSVYAGVEWEAGNISLIETATFSAFTIDFGSGNDNTVNITGPSTAMVGTPYQWNVSLYLPDASRFISVKIVVGGVNQLSLCYVKYLSRGSNYECYVEEQITYDNSIPGEVTVNFDKMVNTGFNKTNNDPLESTVIVTVVGSIPADGVVGDVYTMEAYLYLKGLLVDSTTHNVTAQALALSQSSGSMNVVLSGDDTIELGGRAFINAVLHTVKDEPETYKLTFSNPDTSGYTVHFCSVEVLSVGSNIPCGAVSDNSYISNGNINVKDELVVDFGAISNFQLTSNITNDLVAIKVGVCAIDDGLLEEGEVLTIDVVTLYGSQTLTKTKHIQATVINQTSVQALSVTINNADGYTDIYPGGQSIYELVIDIPASGVYSDLKVKATADNTTFPSTGICDIYLTDLDDNLPCLVHHDPSFKTYDLNRDFNSEGSLTIGPVINNGNITASLKVYIVIVLLDDLIQDGDVVNTFLTVEYNENGVWTGTASRTYSTPHPALTQLPLYEVTPTASIVPVGGAVLIELEMDLPTLSVSSYIVNASAVHSTVSICRIQIKSQGSNVPCLTDDICQEFTSYISNDGNNDAALDLKSITSTGRYNTSDANVIKVEVAAQLMAGFDYSNNASNDIKVTGYDTSGPSHTTVSLYPDSAYSPPAPAPVLSVSKLNGVSEITKGGAASFSIDIFTNPGSITSYSLSVSTTTEKSSICDVRVMGGGKHVPCVNDKGNRTYSSQDGDVTFNEAELIIGTVPNIANSGVVTDPTNKISVEVIISIPSGSTAAGGDTITVSAVLTYGASQTTTASATATVTTSLLAEEKSNRTLVEYIPPSVAPVTAFISDTVGWKVNITMPESTDRFLIRLSLPFSVGEAALTAVSVEYSFIGSNIACGSRLLLTDTFMSEVNSTQMTNLNVDLGYISNVGTFNRYSFRKQQDEDDVLQLTFSIQITDHPNNIHGATNSFDFTTTSDNGVSIPGTQSVVVQSTGNEVADLESNIWIEIFNHYQKNSEDIVKVYGILNLQNTSTAHASTVDVNLIIPHYSQFVALDNYTCIEPTVITTGPNPVLSYNLITFTDIVTFEASFIIDPGLVIPSGRTNKKALVTPDVTYTTLPKAGRIDTAVHSTDLHPLDFAFDSTDCNSLLSIESSDYASCQVKASSEEPSYPSVDALSLSNNGWCPVPRGAPFCTNEYVQLYFGDSTQVTSIGVLSAGNDNMKYITNFQIFYSQEGVLWYAIKENGTNSAKDFNVSFNTTNKVVSDISTTELHETEQFTARYARIIPTEMSNQQDCRPIARLQWYGCKTTIDTNMADACNSTEDEELYTFSSRSYVTNPITGTIFSCVQSNIDSEVVCSRSIDDGNSWEDICPNIGRVDGVVSNTSIAFGTSQDGRSRAFTEDDGVNWIFCSDEEYNEIVLNANTVYAVDFPFNDFSGNSDESLYGTYGKVIPKFGITGTMKGMALKDLTDSTWGDMKVRWGEDDWSSV